MKSAETLARQIVFAVLHALLDAERFTDLEADIAKLIAARDAEHASALDRIVAEKVAEALREAVELCDSWSQSVREFFPVQAMAVEQRARSIEKLIPPTQR